MQGYTADETGAVYDADGNHLGDVELDRYEVDYVAGEGANGVVFAATHTLLEREAMIKVYLPRRDAGRDQYDAFWQAREETCKLLKLDHPAIAAIYDFGQLPRTDWT